MRPAANGKVVVATENAILLQEGDDGRTVRSLEGHAAPVTCLDTFGGGTGCVSGSEDRTVKRWMLENGDPAPRSMPHPHQHQVADQAERGDDQGGDRAWRGTDRARHR